ncbi:hypothetical protein Tco_0206425 [Tanacetum coccineum]
MTMRVFNKDEIVHTLAGQLITVAAMADHELLRLAARFLYAWLRLASLMHASLTLAFLMLVLPMLDLPMCALVKVTNGHADALDDFRILKVQALILCSLSCEFDVVILELVLACFIDL